MIETVRMVPHNIEAENAVLGSILIDPQILDHVKAILSPSDFFIVKNGWIFEALIELDLRRVGIDFLTTCNRMEERGQLSEVGGQSYISELANSVPTAIHGISYARIVREKSERRSKLNAASRIAELAYDETITIDELDSGASSALSNVHQNSANLVSASIVVSNLIDTIGAWANSPLGPGEVRGLSTGFRTIDTAMGGIDDDTLNVVAARPSMGKSALCYQIAENVSKQGKHVAIFSLEMSRQKVCSRLACGRTKINWLHVKRGIVDDDKFQRLINTLSDIGELPLTVCDTTNLSIAQIRSAAMSLHNARPLSLIVVDHMGLVNEKAQTDYQRMGIVSWGLKQIAKDMHVPVLAACQLSRALEARQNKEPVLADLRDSGRIEENADSVMMIYRERYYNEKTNNREAHIFIRKNREGEMNADALLVFFEEYTRFEAEAPLYTIGLDTSMTMIPEEVYSLA